MMQIRATMPPLAIAAALALVSCAAPPAAPTAAPAEKAATAPETDVDLNAEYAARAAAGDSVYTLDPAASRVQIYAFRGGRASRLGHNHVLSAPRFVGYVDLPGANAGGNAAAARFDLEFRLEDLAIDDPADRAALGPAFASKLSPEAIQGTREHMLGDDNLQADRFPTVRIRSLQVTGEAPKYAAQVEIRMHGQARTQWVPLTVEGLPERVSVRGAMVLRQSDFGAKPYSVVGGLLAMQDEVVIEFALAGAPR